MKKYEHLPFEIILSATESDPEAIETVMKFYDGYISKLCLRKLYDEYGNVCMVVDADLKNRVQTALLDMLMNFEIVAGGSRSFRSATSCGTKCWCRFLGYIRGDGRAQRDARLCR